MQCQDTTDLQVDFWNISALIKYMSMQLIWQTELYVGCTLTELLRQASITGMETESMLYVLQN